MAAVSIRLPEDIAQRLHQLATLTGRSKSFYIKAAIMDQLDDLEDGYLAEQRLTDLRAGRSTTHTLADVERELGLAD
jgi:RHH-type transcriptional regulator, rel operon repressor / antitoxin RelB